MADNVLLLVAIVAFLIAVSGVGRHWNPTSDPPSGQYSLRSLVLLLTIAPPAIALLWTQGDFLLKSLERVIPPSRPRPMPAQTPPWVRRHSRNATTDQYAAEMAVFHQLAGWGAALFFSIAAALMGAVFYRSHDWTRPPRQSPLTWATLFMSLLAAATLVAFVLSDPTVLFSPSSDPFTGY